MAEGPYSRIYHELADDYPEVYDGPLLADFVRLLVAAEQAYPTRARWTGHASKRALDRLATIGRDDERGSLITVDGTRFTVKGLEGERGRRMRKASNAASTRWSREHVTSSNAPSNASSTATSNAHSPYRREETRRDEKETSKDETSTRAREGLGHITSEVQDAGEAITGRPITTAGHRQETELDRLCEDHGPDAVVEAMRARADGETLTWRVLVWDTVKRLEPFEGSVSPADRDASERERLLREVRRRAQEAT